MDHLTHEQAEKIRDALWPAFHYLARLKKRLEQVKFPQDDKLFVAVEKAHSAMQDLHVHLHYASCISGVCAPPREEGEPRKSV